MNTKNLCRLFLYFMNALLLVSCVSGNPVVSTPTVESGPEIAPIFNQFFNDYGGQSTMGKPLSKLIPYAPKSNLQVQYFQHFILVYNAENNPEEQIYIFPLGNLALTSNTVTDTETAADYTIANELVAFYDANHGPILLGTPISSPLISGNRLSQFFENGRLSWTPQAASLDIQWDRLGEAHYRSTGIYQEPGASIPFTSDFDRDITFLAHVTYPTLFDGDQQTLYVQALTTIEQSKDTNDKQIATAPISNLPVLMKIYYKQDGEDQILIAEKELGLTDENGKLSATVNDSIDVPGIIIYIRVYAVNSTNRRELGDKTVSFKTWWGEGTKK